MNIIKRIRNYRENNHVQGCKANNDWLDAAEEDYFVKVSPEYRAELDRIDAEMKNGEYITEEDFWE